MPPVVPPSESPPRRLYPPEAHAMHQPARLPAGEEPPLVNRPSPLCVWADNKRGGGPEEERGCGRLHGRAVAFPIRQRLAERGREMIKLMTAAAVCAFALA